MKIKDFLTEQWMNQYERRAVFNLTDTSARSIPARTLVEMEPDILDADLDYGYIPGDPLLRKEVLSLYQDQREETLTFCQGALQGNTMIFDILLSSGDHMITIKPGYLQYADYCRHHSIEVTEVELEKDWSLDLKKVEAAIRPETKMIFFANPSNPTGTYLKGKAMKDLIELCRKYDLWLGVDEVYIVPGKDTPSVSDLYEKSVTTCSLSKTFGLPGLRLGWIKGNPEIIDAINVYRDYTIISCGPLSERLGAAALRHKDQILTENRKLTEQNKALIASWLENNPYFSCLLPEQGSVAFLKIPEGIQSEPFARDLLEETGIFFVPGSCFDKEGYLRLGLGQKTENLDQVLETLNKYTEEYLKSHGKEES